MILICNIEPYQYTQELYLAQDGGQPVEHIASVDLAELYDFAASYCHSNGISTIKLFGSPQYNEMVAQQIKKIDKSSYSDQEPITVEVEI